jgi:metal-sulfur cluster biosynthetic enzyme
MKVEEEIIEVLKECYDPEIPIDLWNLGLIYDINIKESKSFHEVRIIMSLTTPGCSMGGKMAEDIKIKIGSLKHISDVKVDVTFDPPWKPEMMTDFAREKLGFEPVIVQKKENKVDLEWE